MKYNTNKTDRDFYKKIQDIYNKNRYDRIIDCAVNKIPIPHTEKLIFLTEVESNEKMKKRGIEKLMGELETFAQKNLDKAYMPAFYELFNHAKKDLIRENYEYAIDTICTIESDFLSLTKKLKNDSDWKKDVNVNLWPTTIIAKKQLELSGIESETHIGNWKEIN